jgi:tetratricopeptide (TPR) repeat protein
MAAPAWDVFISHADADKPGFVELLASRLQRAGLQVWYGDYSLEWGASTTASIARGLAESRYGIVVLSRSYLREGGSLHQLRGLLHREINVGKTILPILHDISVEEVRKFDLSLADMHPLDTSKNDLDQIIGHALRFLKGEIETGHSRPPDLLDVHALADLSKLRGEEVLTRLERYGTAARLTPGSGETAMGLGLTCLFLKRFPEAIEKLAAAARLLPASGKAHLYYALALLRGRKPRTLSLAEAREVLQALETAAALEPGEGLCDLLAMVVKQEYFRSSGLRVPAPDVDHHRRSLERKPINRDELAAVRGLLVLHDPHLLDAAR